MTQLDSQSPSDARPEDDLDYEIEASSEQSEALDLTVEERKLVTQPYDLGVKGIADDIKSGNIALEIEYQRKYVWDRTKASRLIESLLLNIPIPVCYFAEDEDGVYEVIDGLQRLTTIRDYIEGKFPLSGMPVLTELEGLKFDDLTPRDRRRLENKTIRCIVITSDSHPDIKFDVFERLNTGAAMLTAQELRNSVYRGPFNNKLRALAESPQLKTIVGSASNKRMDIDELVLRYFALHTNIESYKPPLRQFLNKFMRANRTVEPTVEQVAKFTATCEVVHDVLGSDPFRVPGSRNSLNKALFDAIVIPFSLADHEAVKANAKEIYAHIQGLFKNENFLAAIGRATADRQRMQFRIGAVAAGLRSAGVQVDLPPAFLSPGDEGESLAQGTQS